MRRSRIATAFVLFAMAATLAPAAAWPTSRATGHAPDTPGIARLVDHLPAGASAAGPAAPAGAARCGPTGGWACAIELTDIALTAPGQGWVVGEAGYAARFADGRLEPVDTPTDARIEAVAAASSDRAWAVGSGIFGNAEGTWSVAAAGDQWLVDVDLAGPEDGWAVGPPRQAWRYRDGAWAPHELPTDAAVVAVDAVTADEAWAVDAEGTVLRFAGGAWAVDAQLACRPDCRPAAIAMGPDGSGWIAGLVTNLPPAVPIPGGGYRGPLLQRRAPEGGWAQAEVPHLARDAGITALAVAADGTGWAAADTGGMLRLQGGAWSWANAPAAPAPAALVLAEGGGWAVGRLGSVLRLEDGCWRQAGGPRLVASPEPWPDAGPSDPPGSYRALAWRVLVPFVAGQPTGPLLERLTDDPLDEWQPALAPDGVTLAVSRAASGRHSDLVVRDACGNAHAASLPRPSADEVREEVPGFDPGGDALVYGFVHRIDGRDTAAIARVRTDGSGFEILRPATGDAGERPRRPSVSPDGRWLAYDADAGQPTGPDVGEEINREIYVVERATGEARRLTDHPAHDKLPAFAADNETLFFRSERDGNSEIYRINVDGRDLVRITDHPALDTWPSPSPDGRTLVFQSDRTPGEGVYALDLETGVTTRLTSPAYRALTPRVAPDGRSVVFAADLGAGFDVFRMALR